MIEPGGIVSCEVAGDLILRASHPKPLERIRQHLALPNPKYVRAVQMGFHPRGEPATIDCAIEMPDGSMHVPRGAVALVKEQIAKDGFTLKVEKDRRSRGFAFNIHREAHPLTLRDYQSEAVEKCRANTQGLVELPCGCGKTTVGCAIVATIRLSALILVETRDLADQWIEELAVFGIVAGLVGEGRCDRTSDVVVGIIDSTIDLLERDPAWGERFAVVIVDECHHAPAATFQRALSLLPAFFRFGLTATPTREDGLTDLMRWSFGATLLERNTREMIKLGYLMPAEIEFVETGWRHEWDGPSDDPKRIAAMEKALSEDLLRNVTIVDRVIQDVAAGETVLVLANRREMVKEITQLIADRWLAQTSLPSFVAAGVTSQTGKKRRRAMIAALKEGTLPCMVATSLADEGLNVRRLSRVHLAFPNKARAQTTQRLGRLLRLYPGKKPKFVDYTDNDVPTLERRAAERRRVYRETGFID